MTEEQLNAAFCHKFSRWFYIEKEVSPIGSMKRIDVIMKYKPNQNYVFGVELKNPNHKQGTQIEAWLNQARDYSNMEYDINGRSRKIPVLIYPALSSLFFQKDFEHEPIEKDGYKYYRPKHNEFHEHSNVNIFTAMVGLGEIRQTALSGRTGYAIIFRNKLLWHERKYSGIHEVNYNHYFNNR
jgi:hypothetical protein